MKMSLLFLFILGFIYCSNNTTNRKVDTSYKIDTITKHHFKVWADTNFHKLNCGLYINRQGELGYQDFDKPQCDSCWCGNVYVTKAYVCLRKNRAYNKDKSDNDYEYIPLNKIIDTSSLKFLNELYFKDKNRVFYFHNMQEMGTILEVEGADIKSFKTYKDTLYIYGFDKNYFYDGDTTLTNEEVKELGLKRM